MNRALSAADPPRTWQSRTRHHSIRTSLVALVTACVLPSLVALGIVVYEDHLQREGNVGRETQLRAKGLMATVDRDLARVEASLTVLAASGRLSITDLSAFRERLRNTPGSLVILNYRLIDRNGRELINTVVPEGDPMPTASPPPGLDRVFAAGEPVVSTLYEGPVHHQAVIALSVPVRRNGDIVLALTAELSPAQLGGLLVKEPLPSNWIAVLIDSEGTVIARSRSSWRFTGTKIGPDMLAEFSKGQSDGTVETTNREKTPIIASFARSSLTNMGMVAHAPRGILVTQLSSSFAMLIGGGALALAIALWFAVRMAGNISRSVEGLIKPALALGSGKPVELPDSTLREADAVGQALLQAADMLAHAEHQAHHDALTGLCNRVLFDELATHQIAAAQRSGTRLAILAIDLDHFKDVNDCHGHAAGDLVLTTAAERIRQSIRGADIVSRRGGDEFTVLLNNVDQLLTQRIGNKLVSALAKPYPGIDPEVSASIGVAVFPVSGTTLGELLEHADQALYTAKKNGKRCLAGDINSIIDRVGAVA
jgi:diguanylate cyclase (GGDEF)-like protein